MKKAINVIVIIFSVLLIGFIEVLSIMPNIILNSAVTIGAFAISMLIISITMIIQIKKDSNIQEKEIDEFLRINRDYFENKVYKVYFTGAKFIYNNTDMTVQPNELMIAFKE